MAASVRVSEERSVMLCFEQILRSSSICGGTIGKSSRGSDICFAQRLPGRCSDSADMERSMNTNHAHTHGSSILYVWLLPYLSHKCSLSARKIVNIDPYLHVLNVLEQKLNGS